MPPATTTKTKTKTESKPRGRREKPAATAERKTSRTFRGTGQAVLHPRAVANRSLKACRVVADIEHHADHDPDLIQQFADKAHEAYKVEDANREVLSKFTGGEKDYPSQECWLIVATLLPKVTIFDETSTTGK